MTIHVATFVLLFSHLVATDGEIECESQAAAWEVQGGVDVVESRRGTVGRGRVPMRDLFVALK